jgi:phosphoenolpyruvate carboxykinase (GTP)
VEAIDTPIGSIPTPDSLDMTGLDLSDAVLQELLRVDRTEWLKEVEDIRAFFATFNDRLPHALGDEADALKRRLTT